MLAGLDNRLYILGHETVAPLFTKLHNKREEAFTVRRFSELPLKSYVPQHQLAKLFKAFSGHRKPNWLDSPSGFKQDRQDKKN